MSQNSKPGDTAFQLLLSEFKSAPKPALWVVDENIETELIPSPQDGLSAITNRYDLFQALESKGWNCQFSDYNVSALSDQNIQTVLFRISKEKAQTHYIINESATLLSEGGTLIFTGLKKEGIKGYIDRVETNSNTSAERWKSDKQTWAASVYFNKPTESRLEDKDYSVLRPAPQDDFFDFYSKPGVFGWDKVDQGSELLVSHLKQLIPENLVIDKALDLGCGYGYLSLHLARLFNCELLSTDNNFAAISACEENFKRQRVNGAVLASDCGEGINTQFSLIVCNPPFHSGFTTSGDLTDRFLKKAAQRLKPDGVAIFVTNLHIPAERKSVPFFKHCDTPVETKHFKLVRLSGPKLTG